MVKVCILRSQVHRIAGVSALSAAALLSAAACSTQAKAAPSALVAEHSTAASSPAATTRSIAPVATRSAGHPTTGTSTSAPTATSSATSSAATGCASAKGSLAGSSITVCPASAPVGAVVHIAIKGCTTVDPAAGLPKMAAASLSFLGPDSWLGTDGGGVNVPFSPKTGSTEATAAFTIPATYTGGNENGGAYPTLKTKPGTTYDFTTDPAGQCSIHFTVTAS